MLPDSFNYLIDTIDLVPEKDRNINYVREKLLTREAASKKNVESKESKTDENQKASLFEASVGRDSKDVVCYTCNKPGHINKNCYRKFGNNNSFRGRGQQFGNRGRNFSNFSSGVLVPRYV